MKTKYPTKEDLKCLKRARIVPFTLILIMLFDVLAGDHPSILLCALVCYFPIITALYSRQIEKASEELRHLRESLDSIIEKQA